ERLGSESGARRRRRCAAGGVAHRPADGSGCCRCRGESSRRRLRGQGAGGWMGLGRPMEHARARFTSNEGGWMSEEAGGSLRIVGLVGSLRARSYNRMLFRAACELAPASLAIEEVGIGDLPLYNADLDVDEARPEPVVRLRRAVAEA